MKHKIQTYYDVAIIGAGPCGITAANLLGGYGISTLVVDQAENILPIPRAVGMCEEGSRILAAAGILDSVEGDFRAIDKVAFRNKQHAEVFFADTSEPVNGYNVLRTFHQPDLEKKMREHLERFQHVDLFTSTELESFVNHAHGVSLQLVHQGEKLETRCRYMLACDGASSQIRKTLDIGFKGKSYPQDWLILDCSNNPFYGDGIAFSINPERPAVTIQGPGDRRRWEFLIKDDDDPEQLMSDEGINNLLQPWCDPGVVTVERKAVYTFHARVADRFQDNNVFLLGDAAHITPPFAGQGMMAGLRDAYNISWKLASVLNRQLSPQILGSYQTERIPQCRQVVGFAQFMGTIILPQNYNIAKLRDGVFKVLGWLGLHSADKGVHLKKVENHINGGYYRNILRRRLLHTGTEFPQLKITSRGGEQLMADKCLGDHFYLLGWNANPENQLKEGTRRRWQSIAGKSAVFAESLPAGADFFDPESNYAELFQTGKRVMLIRPDKMIVIYCKPSQLDNQLSRYLDRVTPATKNNTVAAKGSYQQNS